MAINHLQKKPWLRGGIIGFTVCLVLFLFYVLVYFPLLNTKYDRDLPDFVLVPPVMTGHFFPTFFTFFIPNDLFCKPTHTICTGWQAENTGSGIPWRLESGEYGYCMDRTDVPDLWCTDYFEKVNFFVLAMLLFAIYFAIGAFIGHFWEKRKSRQNLSAIK